MKLSADPLISSQGEVDWSIWIVIADQQTAEFVLKPSTSISVCLAGK